MVPKVGPGDPGSTSDIDFLVAAFERGELLRPWSGALNVVDLARALARLAGVGEAPRSPGTEEIERLVGPSDHLIFVLADGLGQNLLDELPGDAFLVRHRIATLRSIFPSTTASVLTTLATGAWPSQHGVTGQWTYLPEISGTAALLPFAARSGGRSLTHLGVTVNQAFPLTPVLSLIPRDVLTLFPTSIVNSASSVYFSGSRSRAGYESLTRAVDAMVDRISRAGAPTYTYLYSPRIDAESHYLGIKHGGVRAVLNELDREIERLADNVGGRARIVVAADHGLLDTGDSYKHAFKPSTDLFGTLRSGPSGDDRVLYFHLQSGAEERFIEWVKPHYGNRFFLISVDDAERHHLFGPEPIAPAVRGRFGEVMLLSKGTDVIEYVLSGQIGRRVDLNAFHSGLSPAEMQVPLIVV
jgi:hypothetical protein